MYLNDGRKEVNGQPAGKKNSLFWYLYESLFEYSFFLLYVAELLCIVTV